MMRLIAVLVLLAALIGLAVAEQVTVDHVYGKMKTETAAVMELVKLTTEGEPKTEFGQETKDRIDDMHAYWLGKERKLGIIIKHIDLSYISDALIYARNFIHSGNKEEALGGLRRLEYLLESYHGVYGLNGVNIL